MTKVLFISHTLIFKGGAERSLLLYLQNSRIPKNEYLVVVPGYVKNGFADQLQKNNIPHIIIEKGNFRNRNIISLLNNAYIRIKYILKISALIISLKTRIIHLNSLRCNLEGCIGTILRKHVIHHIRGLDGNWKKRTVFLKYFTNELICVAVSEKEVLQSIGYNKSITVVPNGIDADSIISKKSKSIPKRKEINVGMVGNIDHRKGIDIFCDIASEVLDTYKNVIFFVYGGVSDKEYYNSIYQKHKKNIDKKKIRFMGHVSSHYKIYDNLDILLFTARIEGFPRVVLEAMVFKVPVITFNRDGRKDQIVNNESGVLVEDVKEMKSKLQHLLENEKERKMLANKAYKRVQNEFSSKRYIQMMNSFFR